MSVSLTWRKRLDARKIKRRFVNDRVCQYAHLQLWRLCSPYVPMQTGDLMENVEITPEHLRYAAPYAARMYYGVGYRFKKDRHPLATAMWDKAAMQTQRDKLTREIAAYMGRQEK